MDARDSATNGPPDQQSGGYRDYHTATFGRLLEWAARHGTVARVDFSADERKRGTIVVDVRDDDGRPHLMRITYRKNESKGPTAAHLFFDGGAMHEAATAEQILRTVDEELRSRTRAAGFSAPYR